MKNTITTLLLVLFSLSTWAQAPEQMTYQAVVRDAGNVLITSTTVGVQMSILKGSSTGTAVYVETHTPTTNVNGLMSFEIGLGTLVSGNFSSIDWSIDLYFLKSEIDPTGGTSYTVSGTSQLVSVPYALHSTTVEFGNTLDEAYDVEAIIGPSTRLINADDGEIKIVATGNNALEIESDPGFIGLEVTSASTDNAVEVIQSGSGDAMLISNSGTGRGIRLNQSNATNTTNAFFVKNEGLGKAMRLWNSNPTNIQNVFFLKNDGAGKGFRIQSTNAAAGATTTIVDNATMGVGMKINNTNAAGTGEGLEINQAADATALSVLNTGLSGGIEVNNLNPLSTGEALKVVQTAPETALFVDNAGLAGGVSIFNGNPLGAGVALEVIHAGVGFGLVVDQVGASGITALLSNADPTNPDPVLIASAGGLGNVAVLNTTDNNANLKTTLFARNLGAGTVAEFITEDEPIGKVNTSPTVRISSNGKGPGLSLDISNFEAGVDTNIEPVLIAEHMGFGNVAVLTSPNPFSSANTLEITNNGGGHGVHIDSFGSAIDTEASLYVEQGNGSLGATFGRTAVFDLHPAGTFADSAVLIRSGAVDPSHSALRVFAADPLKMAATFSGNVDVINDLIVGHDATVAHDLLVGNDAHVVGLLSAGAKAFKIDHPLDPENKFLYHNSIESDKRINMYSGNITTDVEGYATVILPDYMCALNKDFKYQLTIIDKSFAQAVIWEPIANENNSFIIKTNAPSIGVSWQITGTRQDTWALENPMKVEVNKYSEL